MSRGSVAAAHSRLLHVYVYDEYTGSIGMGSTWMPYPYIGIPDTQPHIPAVGTDFIASSPTAVYVPSSYSRPFVRPGAPSAASLASVSADDPCTKAAAEAAAPMKRSLRLQACGQARSHAVRWILIEHGMVDRYGWLLENEIKWRQKQGVASR